MQVKLTFPAPGFEHRVGHVVEVDPQTAQKWLDKEWCIEVSDQKLPKPKKVKYEPKPTQEH